MTSAAVKEEKRQRAVCCEFEKEDSYDVQLVANGKRITKMFPPTMFQGGAHCYLGRGQWMSFETLYEAATTQLDSDSLLEWGRWLSEYDKVCLGEHWLTVNTVDLVGSIGILRNHPTPNVIETGYLLEITGGW
jgi:hypothetical protein